MDTRAYRPDIDGLRCFAVSAVVLSHAGLSWFAGGYVGVDVFFVISGYLITGILWAGLDDYPRSIAVFYERRARRILPALMVAVAATLVGGAFLLGPGQFAALGKSAIATTLFVSNLWFWRASGDYFAADVKMEPLLHTWSLAVEEQFYIVFPLLMALAARFARRRVLHLIVAVCLVSFALSVHAIATAREQTAFYLLQSRAWELGLGAVLALTNIPVPRRRAVIEVIALLAAAAILAPVFLYGPETPFPGLAALPPVLGTAVLIWLNRDTGNAVKSVLGLRPIVFVGLISYSVYVWHWPIIVFDKMLFGPPTILRALILIAASLAAGAASWWWVERPFRNSAGPLRTRSSVFKASGAAMAAMTVVALAIWVGHGFPQRLPPDVLRTFAAAKDIHPLSRSCRGPSRIGSESCRFGAAAHGKDADFLLWGDSHAGAVVPAVERAAQSVGKSGFIASLSGCPPLLHVDRLDLGPTHHCAAFNDEVLRFLQGRADMPVVILAARWALAAEGDRPDGAGEDALLKDRTLDLPSGDIDDNLAIFDAGMRDTVAAIRATGRQVVILGGVPEIGWPVPETLALSEMDGAPVPPAPTAEEVEMRNAPAVALFDALDAQPGVRFVSLTATFCNPDCAVRDAEARPVYVDDDHLSWSGANGYLAPLLIRTLWKSDGEAAVR
jgi:peptidoglycan/LPS O-acetylase OafA/YrhL